MANISSVYLNKIYFLEGIYLIMSNNIEWVNINYGKEEDLLADF
jgi:hypothetical protein